jgi:hypothetical protein
MKYCLKNVDKVLSDYSMSIYMNNNILFMIICYTNKFNTGSCISYVPASSIDNYFVVCCYSRRSYNSRKLSYMFSLMLKDGMKSDSFYIVEF